MKRGKGIPRWAKWKVRGPDGWTEYFAQKPKARFDLSVNWDSKGKRDLEGQEYFDRQELEPKWWFRKGPLPWFVWVIVSRFTLRRIRDGN